MKQEKDKELLLRDLGARISYGVICQIENVTTPNRLTGVETDGPIPILTFFINEYKGHKNSYVCTLNEIKPFLRPMSSMTEDEKIEWDAEYAYNSKSYEYEEYLSKMIDWLNAHHFDYRGLIKMGLAIEAPEGMYEEKTS